MGNFVAYSKFGKKPDYILNKIKHPGNIGKLKKTCAKRAILWLLSKAPHSVKEIADHFEISPELIKFFIGELIADKKVVKLEESSRYKVTLNLYK